MRSGATEKALQERAMDYGSTKYDNFLNRYYNKLRPLQSMAGLGQTSAGQTAQLGVATGQNVSQNYLSGAYNAINARLAGASGLATGLSQAGQSVWDYYSGAGSGSGNNYLTQATGGKNWGYFM